MAFPPSTNHIRDMSELMKDPMHGWVLYPILRALLKLTVAKGGSLSGDYKNGSKVVTSR